MRTDGQFADYRASTIEDRIGKFAMLRGINHIHSASHYGHSLAASIEGSLMCGPIDTARQTADDGKALGRQFHGETLRHPESRLAGGARTHYREASRLTQ